MKWLLFEMSAMLVFHLMSTLRRKSHNAKKGIFIKRRFNYVYEAFYLMRLLMFPLYRIALC